jgi:hypothetical protein
MFPLRYNISTSGEFAIFYFAGSGSVILSIAWALKINLQSSDYRYRKHCDQNLYLVGVKKPCLCAVLAGHGDLRELHRSL